MSKKETSLFKAPDITKYAVSITPAGTKRKNALLILGKGIETVSNQTEHDLALDAAKSLKGFSKEIERARVELTAPALTVQRLLKTTADTAVKEIIAETLRIERLIADYRLEQERIRRNALLEQQLAAQEAQAKRDEEDRQRQAEADRLAREAEEARRAGDIKAANELESQQLAKELEAEEQLPVVIAHVPIPAPAPTGGGSLRPEVKFEVLDTRALYEAFPQFVNLEVKVRELKAFLSLDSTNIDKIPGVRAWKEDRFISSTR